MRFGERLWTLIEDEANIDNVSAAHWIREAALIRAMLERQERGIPNGPEVLAAIREMQVVESDTLVRARREVLEYARDELEAALDKISPACAAVIRRQFEI